MRVRTLSIAIVVFRLTPKRARTCSGSGATFRARSIRMTRAWPTPRRSSPERRRRGCSAAAAVLVAALLSGAPSAGAQQQVPATIERVKASVVGVGTFQQTRTPAFRFLGTGFAVGNGSTIVTNAHVLPPKLEDDKGE